MTENTVLSIDNWDEICSLFSKMFEGLGEIESNEEYVSYNSIPPYVATGITVNKQGIILANMPLHSVQTEYEYVEFDSELKWMSLYNSKSKYTYKIPSEILSQRK